MQELAKVLGVSLGECQVGTRGQGVKQEEQDKFKYKSEKKKRKRKQIMKEEEKQDEEEKKHEEEDMKDGEDMQEEQVSFDRVKVEKIEDEEIACSLCAEKFKSRKTLGKHLLRTHGEGFTCSQCSEPFKTSLRLAQHLSRVHGMEDLANPKTEEYDGEEAEDQNILKPNQLEIETNTIFPETYQPETYLCKKCPLTFSNKMEKSSHTKSAHSVAVIPCDECDNKFSRKDRLDAHKKVVHKGTYSGGRPIKCFICEKAFTILDDLKKHILIHSNVSG